MAEQSDFERAQEFMREQMQQLLPEVLPQAVQAYTRSQQQPSAEQQQYRQAEQAVRGIVQQDIDNANLTSRNAMDMVNFYLDDPLAREYQKEVEASFDIMMKNNRPTSRADILSYEMGREMRAEPAKFEERQARVRKAQLARAQLAGDVGEGAEGRSGGDKYTSLDKLSKQSSWSDDDVKQLESMLDGEVF